MRAAALYFFMTFLLVSCSDTECLTYQQEYELIKDATNLESDGHLLKAYRQYSFVANQNCRGDELISIAGGNSHRLATLIRKACAPVSSGIKAYYKKHGTQPISLEIFRNEIPPESIQAFNEFKLVKFADGTEGLDCGYYGPINLPAK